MLYLAYTEPRKEEDVQAQCVATGARCWFAARATFKQVGTDRRAHLVYDLDFPRVVFLWANDEQLDAIRANVRYLNTRQLQSVGPMDERQVIRYRADLLKDNRDAERLDAAVEGRRKLISAFKAGQVLEVIKGPLSGLVGGFVQMVERNKDPHPMAQMDGPMGKVYLDPLHVKVSE